MTIYKTVITTSGVSQMLVYVLDRVNLSLAVITNNFDLLSCAFRIYLA